MNSGPAEAIQLDGGSLHVPAGALSWRERNALRGFYMLPPRWREFLFFNIRPWSLPFQNVLAWFRGNGREVEFAFSSGPLAGLRFGACTAEKLFLLGANFEQEVGRRLNGLVPRGGVAYDIGANAGFWVLALARQVGSGGKVVAFEPSPVNYGRLLANILRNRKAPGIGAVVPFNCAVGDRSGRLQLVEAGTRSHLKLSEEAEECTPGVEVDVVRLDDLVADGRIPGPSLILLDVEGAGGLVLDGAQELLARFRPRLLMEVHSPAEQAAIERALAPHGYGKLERIDPTERLPVHVLAEPAAVPTGMFPLPVVRETAYVSGPTGQPSTGAPPDSRQ